jgi:hypothetical protein
MSMFNDAKPLVMSHSERPAFCLAALKALKWSNKYVEHDQVVLISPERIARLAFWPISTNQERCFANAFYEPLSGRLS